VLSSSSRSRPDLVSWSDAEKVFRCEVCGKLFDSCQAAEEIAVCSLQIPNVSFHRAVLRENSRRPHTVAESVFQALS
jgi:hypothetical protein